MKEYRVKFYSEEDGSYVELWKLVDQEKFIARHTWGPKCWYYVSDPLGYRELDHPMRDDVTVIVCDQNGNELFRTSNADDSVNFNTPKQEAHEQWAKFVENTKTEIVTENQSAQFMAHWMLGTPVGRFNDWLLSFQDPELYEGARDYPENWLHCRNEQVGEFETLAEYTYLGETKKIERGHFRHMICGAEWDEYYSGNHFIGHTFDDSHVGTMYSEIEARRILSAAIKSHFPEARVLSVVHEYTPKKDGPAYYKEEHLRAEYAWERIAAPNSPDGRGRKNLRRSFIDAEAAKEREHSRFFATFEQIKAIYPDCIRDYNFLY